MLMLYCTLRFLAPRNHSTRAILLSSQQKGLRIAFAFSNLFCDLMIYILIPFHQMVEVVIDIIGAAILIIKIVSVFPHI